MAVATAFRLSLALRGWLGETRMMEMGLERTLPPRPSTILETFWMNCEYGIERDEKKSGDEMDFVVVQGGVLSLSTIYTAKYTSKYNS